MHLGSRLALVALLLATSGCRSDDQKLIGDWEDLASTIEANQGDCDKMADAIESYDKKKGDDFRELQKRWEEKHAGAFNIDDNMKAVTARVLGATARCVADKRVAAAMKALRAK
jgi:hypothetical protein